MEKNRVALISLVLIMISIALISYSFGVRTIANIKMKNMVLGQGDKQVNSNIFRGYINAYDVCTSGAYNPIRMPNYKVDGKSVNTAYWIKGNVDQIAPEYIYDDGKSTHFIFKWKFPNNTLPSLTAFMDEEGKILSIPVSSYKEKEIVADSVIKTGWVLRHGNNIVCVFRMDEGWEMLFDEIEKSDKETESEINKLLE